MTDYFRVIYSPAARDDLHNIAAYIINQLNNPQAAKNIIKMIQNKIHSLSAMPERYALVDWEPWLSMKMHKIPVGRYIIFYIIDSDINNVIIARIFYSRRNVEQIIQSSDE